MERNQILPYLVSDRAKRDPDGIVLQHVDGHQLSAAEFHRGCLAWATGIETLGISQGDTVVVMLAPSFTALEAWLGLATIGAIEVPVNTQYKGRVLEHVLRDSGAGVAIVQERFLEQFTLAAEAIGVEFRIVLVPDDVASPSGSSDAEQITLSHDLIEPGAEPRNRPKIRERDTSCILYTSGTTGPSKGVIIPWGQQYATAHGVLPLEDLGPQDSYYAPFPTFHVSGKFPLYCMMIVGGKVVLREQFKTHEFWDDIRKFGCTTTLMLGAMTNFLYKEEPREDDAENTLKNILMVPTIPEVEEFKKRFEVRVYTVFNMTEISCPVTSDGWNLGPAGSCGTVREGYDVRLVNEDDVEVPVGTMGELVVRSDTPWTLMGGYWGLPEKTAESWRNLWLHTGDAFIQDQDGNFYFVDRMKDAIRRRGENISSAEVEAEVLECPEVKECAVVAVPSEWGEDEILAVIVADGDLDPEALWGFCAERLPKFMVPRFFRFVDEIPKTPTEKIRKVELRDVGTGTESWDAMEAGLVGRTGK